MPFSNNTGILGLIGTILALMITAIIGLWRRLENTVDYHSCEEKLGHQMKVNIELIERMAKVETKLEMGFKMLGEKIDNKVGRK